MEVKLRAVAATLFWTKGYSATTTRELAAALGVQKASIYHYIRSKEDLLYALCVESLENIHYAVEKATTGIDDPEERIRKLIEAHVLAMLEDKDKHATMLTELRSLTEGRRARVIELRDAYEKLVLTTLSNAQSSGMLRDDVPATYLKLSLLNLLNWSIFWYRSDREMSPEQLSRTFAELFLGGAASSRG